MRLARSFWWPLGVALLTFMRLFPLIAPTVTTMYGGADGGELASAVWLSAVPHPPGYPTYLLFGRVALLVPWGEPAWRLGVLSVAAVSWTSACVTATVQCLLRSKPYANLNASMCGLMLAFDPLLVQQALIVEVYPLALAFWATLIWLLARCWHGDDHLNRRAIGLLLGVGLGTQPTLVALLAGIGITWFLTRQRLDWATFLVTSLWMCLGLLVYAILPWRGQTQALSWGDWWSWQGALAHIQASEYRYLVGIVPWNERIGRLSIVLTDLASGLQWWGLAVALWGIVAAEHYQRWRIFTISTSAIILIWTLSYGGADGRVYALPIHLLVVGWVGVGLTNLLESAQPRIQRISLGCVIILLTWHSWQLQKLSLANHTQERDRMIAQLESTPFNGTILTHDDRQTFPLWYTQRVLGIRPDVTIIDQRLRGREWYEY